MSFYDHYSIGGAPRAGADELQSLFARPGRVQFQDHYHVTEPNAVQQADILMLPTDAGYKYALVVVDLATRRVGATPMKQKDAVTTKRAFEKIWQDSSPLYGHPENTKLKPPDRLEVDDGKEFFGACKTYLGKEGVFIRRGRPGRHQQQGAVENVNRILGRAIMIRQTGQELLTGASSTEWVSDLPNFVNLINKRLQRAPPKPVPVDTPMQASPAEQHILLEGTPVLVKLDRPQDVRGKVLPGVLRAGDIKWDPTPRTVELVILQPGSPPRYIVSGIPETSFRRVELQIIDSLEPPDGEIVVRGKHDRFRPLKLHGEKEGKFHVQWRGFPDEAKWTWETAATLRATTEGKKLLEKFTK